MPKFEALYVSNEVEVGEDDILAWVSKNKYPEDVFSKKELEEWALENGFVKESSQ